MRPLYACIQCPARGEGEDRVHVVEHDDQLIIAVADGAGGLGGGAAAAERVVSLATSVGRTPREAHEARYWMMRLLEADAALAALGDGQAAAVVASVFRDEVVGAVVGDAVAWLVSSSGVDDLTVSAKRKPLLGDGGAVPCAFGPVRLGSATLLLATDGLWKYAARATIGQCVLNTPIPGPCTEVVDAVRLASGGLQDDVGAVLVRSPQVIG